MFTIAEVEDHVRILPQYFGNELEAVEIELNKKYANKVLRNVGLIVSLYAVDHIDEGVVYIGQGSSYSKVKFRLVAFMPFVGETLTGTVEKADAKSLTVSLGFFDNIVIPGTELKDPAIFREDTGMWYWRYEAEGMTHDMAYTTGEPVRVRVTAIEFTKDQKLNELLPPMIIYASTAEDGLGLIQWWF